MKYNLVFLLLQIIAYVGYIVNQPCANRNKPCDNLQCCTDDYHLICQNKTCCPGVGGSCSGFAGVTCCEGLYCRILNCDIADATGYCCTRIGIILWRYCCPQVL